MSDASAGLVEELSRALDLALPAALRAPVEAVLDAFWRDAHARFPGVKIAPGAYASFLAGKLRQSGKSLRELETLHGVDLFLALGCAQGDRAAIAAFDAQLIAKVSQYVRRADADVDEIAQKLREKLLVPKTKGALPRIADYLGTGSLEGWVRIAAVRVAISLRRSAVPWRFADAAKLDTVAAGAGSPESDVAQAQLSQHVARAFREALDSLSQKQRDLLRFYHLDDTTLDKLAVIYGVHLSTVARWIEQARTQLRDGTLERIARAAPNAATTADELEGALDEVIAKLL
ncbi:MAG: sigma-70 family RNA polymerase sigma factor [Deltaproteobacteria bacterium]|nr:sigma-70 family RNA polymerase sigma factor [Deltaproteobacteria bacterium]